MNLNKLNKYAQLITEVGANVQKGQTVVINSPVECKEFARLLVEKAYRRGAAEVIMRWNDEIVMKQFYTYAKKDVLQEVPDYFVAQHQYFIDKTVATISISAPTPELLKDIEPNKIQVHTKAINQRLDFYRKFLMGNGAQWCIASYPTEEWATKVFPGNNSFDKLLDAILIASRVTEENDPVLEWQEHIKNLAKRNKILNDYNFAYLKFKNALGTDIKIGLVDGHIWAGGGETAKNGVVFAPNIPTEEAFTMPHKAKVNGKVVATKPLNYNGKLIEDFYLIFKDGKVVEYGARQEKETLKNLLEVDAGSSSIGELALIPHDSPISNTGILFYNTLFDENASCHLALGSAYSMNIKDSEKMTEKEMIAQGFNKSMIHVDFMFGSEDMGIVGITPEGKEVTVFKNGNFVF
ncbi:MAG: aminopeptidase [Bacilli bacterium]|nr:aminopeptidase [Bacilli bacterium]MDD4076574.1 aminopeptidase [Bacilli bacterium]